MFSLVKMSLPFKHPCTIIVAGPTQSGKSTFIQNLVKEKEKLFDQNLFEVIYCLPRGRHVGETLREEVKVFEGIPDSELFSDCKPRLIILDDLMRETDGNVVDLFTKGSHHYNITVIFITQNIFNQGKGQRDISLNAHYVICFKNPRDRQQIMNLARQVYPEDTKFLQEAYKDATSKAFGYLLLDLTQTQQEEYRFRSNIFSFDNPQNIIYVPKSMNINTM
jgi:DNA polymerase III delta prime subunit